MPKTQRRRICSIICILLVAQALVLLSSCSASKPVDVPEVPAEASEPVPQFTWSVLTADGETLHFENGRNSDSIDSILGKLVVGPWPSPFGERVAASVASNDSTRLLLVDMQSGERSALHAGPGRVEYSVAWSPDGRYLSAGFSGGAGRGVLFAGPDMRRIQPVGCSAAYIAYAIRDDGRLVVGDGSNLYLVETDDCATVSSIDLSKRHHVNVSPTGEHVAYIFRELVFNRREYSYDPDSTLFIRTFEESEEIRVTSDRYRARNMEWSPGGNRLAFDVRSVDETQERQVAYFDLDTGQAGFVLQPGDMNMPVDRRPVWSPSGDAVAFERIDAEANLRQLAVRHEVERRLYLVDAIPLDDEFEDFLWVDDRTLAVTTRLGGSGLLDLDGTEMWRAESGRSIRSAVALSASVPVGASGSPTGTN